MAVSTATPPDLTLEQLRAAHIAAVLLGYISLARARLRDWAMHSYGTDLEAELRTETTATTH